jgi:kinetochore protein Nuf2
MTELISRTRARIVQSPERITNNIRTMSTTLAQDKHTVTLNETKIRDLQARSTALIAIEKVCVFLLYINLTTLTINC